MPQVLNKKTIGFIPTNAVYVGRGSKWGNPFKITATQNREQVIDTYREYAAEEAYIAKAEGGNWLQGLEGKDLICYCAPLPCHANVLLEMLDQ